MDLNDLKRRANDPIWDDEAAQNPYAFPLPADEHATERGRILTAGIASGELYRVGPFIAAKSPASHIGPFRWAIDFLIPDGTPVLAARSGRVIEVQEGNERWGDDPSFQNDLNYITIAHPNGEYSQYCHLARGSVSGAGVRRGQWVHCGERIATVGKTGWTDRDHLHFIVFRDHRDPQNPYGFKSLRVSFT